MSTLIHQTNKTGLSYRYAYDGTDNEGNISLRFDPVPDAGIVIHVLGHQVLADLKSDTDELRLPDQPVLYYALLWRLGERGEVGGQTAQELFSMASQYISDAIALDANLSPTEKNLGGSLMAQRVNQFTIRGQGFRGLNTEMSPIGSDPSYALRADNCVIDRVGRIAAREAFAAEAEIGPNIWANTDLTNISAHYTNDGYDSYEPHPVCTTVSGTYFPRAYNRREG